MRRLSADEISILKLRLCEWLNPSEMQKIVDSVNTDIGSEVLFNQAGLAFLRDAWIAAEVAIIQGADLVRLVSDEWPDFEVRINHETKQYEAVEADDPARRRGDEYKNLEDGEMEEDPVGDWIERANQSSQWIANACSKKAKKRYAANVNLIVYLNMSEFGIRHDEVLSNFSGAVSSAKNSFEEIWILWKKKLYRAYP